MVFKYLSDGRYISYERLVNISVVTGKCFSGSSYKSPGKVVVNIPQVASKYLMGGW